jgi:hypothetical protein
LHNYGNVWHCGRLTPGQTRENPAMAKVHVVVVDYGLNGADVLGVYRQPPGDELITQLVNDTSEHPRLSGVTGFSGWTTVECEVIE